VEPLISLELRWFFPEDVPREVADWFRTGLPGSNASAEDRPDTYLLQVRHDDFGIKFRGGDKETDRRLEVKWRQSAKPYKSDNGFEGQVERWVKWGWKDPKIPLPHEDMYIGAWSHPDGPWVTVAKERWQRKYGWEDGKFTSVPTETILEMAAVVEMAKFKLGQRVRGSLLVETYAPTARGQQLVLDAAVTDLFKEYPGAPPMAEWSYGYPHWLATMLGGS